MAKAYTIGNEANYDRAIAAQASIGDVVRKMGKGDGGRDPGYPGGSVWRTSEDARRWTTHGPYAVYEVELPGSWDECVYEHSSGTSLLVDAVITRKVEKHDD